MLKTSRPQTPFSLGSLGKSRGTNSFVDSVVIVSCDACLVSGAIRLAVVSFATLTRLALVATGGQATLVVRIGIWKTAGPPLILVLAMSTHFAFVVFIARVVHVVEHAYLPLRSFWWNETVAGTSRIEWLGHIFDSFSERGAVSIALGGNALSRRKGVIVAHHAAIVNKETLRIPTISVVTGPHLERTADGSWDVVKFHGRCQTMVSILHGVHHEVAPFITCRPGPYMIYLRAVFAVGRGGSAKPCILGAIATLHGDTVLGGKGKAGTLLRVKGCDGLSCRQEDKSCNENFHHFRLLENADVSASRCFAL
jgi:hypothetical protein